MNLVIYQGDDDYMLSPVDGESFAYQIGGGRLLGECHSLNDDDLLNKYAKDLTHSYSAWVYSYNNFFLKHGFVSEDLSLFFLSDFSCKRSEIFETYSVICNISVLRDKLSGCALKEVDMIGVTDAFVSAFQSLFPDVLINVQRVKPEKINGLRRGFSDLRYMVEIFCVILINAFLRVDRHRRNHKKTIKYFFSSYPLMFNEDDVEEKYRGFVGHEDSYAISIVTDGLHQHVNPLEYYRYRRKLLSKPKFHVIDDYIRLGDLGVGIYWLIRSVIFRTKDFPQRFIFNGIDIKKCLENEWKLSFSRISRLMLLKGAFRRFFLQNKTSDVIYYLHEFPYGRLLTYILGTQHPDVNRIGFQHGPASWRKLFYFMSENEASAASSYIKHAPIPDKVLAEDNESRKIYQNAGYKNITVMDKVYRLSYLKNIKLSFDQTVVLIAPGLHDAKLMLSELLPIIQKNKHITYLLKLHPRAKKEKLNIEDIKNLDLTTESVAKLYEKVGKVFVTYSSVGMEANSLGLDVELVNVPGVINESPLVDKMAL